MIKLAGVDCGPVRLPMVVMMPDEVAALERDLAEIGFLDWMQR
jgi:hypothetical protein